MLNTHEPDDGCCGPALSAAILAGLLDDAAEWECPECGCAWRPSVIGNAVRWWEPHPTVVVIRRAC